MVLTILSYDKIQDNIRQKLYRIFPKAIEVFFAVPLLFDSLTRTERLPTFFPQISSFKMTVTSFGVSYQVGGLPAETPSNSFFPKIRRSSQWMAVSRRSSITNLLIAVPYNQANKLPETQYQEKSSAYLSNSDPKKPSK